MPLSLMAEEVLCLDGGSREYALNEVVLSYPRIKRFVVRNLELGNLSSSDEICGNREWAARIVPVLRLPRKVEDLELAPHLTTVQFIPGFSVKT